RGDPARRDRGRRDGPGGFRAHAGADGARRRGRHGHGRTADPGARPLGGADRRRCRRAHRPGLERERAAARPGPGGEGAEHVGREVSIRVRSPNSVQLSSFPIVIVDGVRYNSFQEIANGVTSFTIEPTSRLNDLNPNDIESIEVVKGPSATALYGTDAANGVIVIKTKMGQPGPARWRAYARAGITEIPDPKSHDVYWGWHSGTGSCTLRNVSLGSCAQDSVSVLANPYDDPDLTIF